MTLGCNKEVQENLEINRAFNETINSGALDGKVPDSTSSNTLEYNSYTNCKGTAPYNTSPYNGLCNNNLVNTSCNNTDNAPYVNSSHSYNTSYNQPYNLPFTRIYNSDTANQQSKRPISYHETKDIPLFKAEKNTHYFPDVNSSYENAVFDFTATDNQTNRRNPLSLSHIEYPPNLYSNDQGVPYYKEPNLIGMCDVKGLYDSILDNKSYSNYMNNNKYDSTQANPNIFNESYLNNSTHNEEHKSNRSQKPDTYPPNYYNRAQRTDFRRHPILKNEMVEQKYICLHSENECRELISLARKGALRMIRRRLTELEKKSIKPGSIFIYSEEGSGIKRWTDSKAWSPSRVLGPFLTYKELEGELFKKTFTMKFGEGTFHIVCYSLNEWERSGKCCKIFGRKILEKESDYGKERKDGTSDGIMRGLEAGY